jgi:hypothetical protein
LFAARPWPNLRGEEKSGSRFRRRQQQRCCCRAPPPAHAEFEIQEATIEQGEIQIQYSGAEHWGLAGPEYDPLRQSHELELQMGITDDWLLSVLALKLNAQLDF